MQTTLEAPKRSTTPTADELNREPAATTLNPRCNVPIDLRNWDNLAENVREELTWFHQHIFDEGLTNQDAAKALGYDWTVVYRCLKGTYEGNWENIRKAIVKYRAILRERKKIQQAQFVPNRNTRLICKGLDYMMASNTIVLILGPSRMGKSLALDHWRHDNNSGRTVLVNTPVRCTPMTLLRAVCERIGRKPGPYEFMASQIRKALNKGRSLLFDEAHFFLPTAESSATCLEIVRRFHDETKCGLGFAATTRFGADLEAAEYQFEQLLGRIDQPVYLFRTLEEDDIRPLLEQYFTQVTDFIIETSLAIVNDELGSQPRLVKINDKVITIPRIHGRYGALVGLLRRASHLSADERANKKMHPKHFAEALAVRIHMTGQIQYAKH